MTIAVDLGRKATKTKATYESRLEKTCLRGFANKGADQPAQTDQGLCYSLTGKYHN